MLNLIFPLLLALAGGVGGFFLRRWELSTVFDSNGLPALWSTPSLLLIALSVVLAAAFLLLVRRPRYLPADYSEAFCPKGCWLYPAGMALSAAALLFAGVLGFRYGGYCSLLCKLTNLMFLLSFLCILVVAWTNFRGRPLRYSLPLLVPGYTLCLWLVSAYQQRAADPVVLNYVYELLAIICTLLCLYFSAGYSFGRPKFIHCAFTGLLGIYFTMVTFADAHTTADRLVLLFALLYQLLHVIPLLYHSYLAPIQTKDIDLNHTQEVSPDE